MAVKWLGEIQCPWCDGKARAGVEKDGNGRTYRVICVGCGATTQAGRNLPAGRKIAQLLEAEDSHGGEGATNRDSNLESNSHPFANFWAKDHSLTK